MNDRPRTEPFAVTSLIGDGGLSNFVVFVFPDEVVLCDFGALGSLWTANWLASSWWAEAWPGGDISTWCAEAQRQAKRVVVVPDRNIQSVHVRLRMLRHQIVVTVEKADVEAAGYRSVRRDPGAVYRLGLLEREEVEPASRLLAARFGARFQVSATPAYALFHRVAPGLTR